MIQSSCRQWQFLMHFLLIPLNGLSSNITMHSFVALLHAAFASKSGDLPVADCWPIGVSLPILIVSSSGQNLRPGGTNGTQFPGGVVSSSPLMPIVSIVFDML